MTPVYAGGEQSFAISQGSPAAPPWRAEQADAADTALRSGRGAVSSDPVDGTVPEPTEGSSARGEGSTVVVDAEGDTTAAEAGPVVIGTGPVSVAAEASGEGASGGSATAAAAVGCTAPIWRQESRAMFLRRQFSLPASM